MMGQQPSSRAQRSLSRTDSLRESLQRKLGRTKHNYSATFNFQDVDLNWDLLNINTATEEELMTLPTINRTVAHNIVEYRQDIGGFKKVEDLALVSGVGASKLELFRSEITVNHRKRLNNNNSFLNYTSRCSSQNQSLESLPTSDSSSRLSMRHGSAKVVNVNTTNVFQLMSIRGVNQELAANIVDFRDRKGFYNLISDLLKVKGMTAAKLSAIRANLCIEQSHLSNGQQEMNGQLSSHNSFNQGSGRITPKNHKRTRSSASNKSSPKGLSNEVLIQEIYNLLLRHNNRPILEDHFGHERNEKPALRVATWNLEDFSTGKSKNLGVQEVICLTLLENGLSLVAVHELYSQEALNSIVSELNEPSLPTMKSWENNHGVWFISAPVMSNNIKSIEKKHLLSGFLYETTHGLHLKDTCFMDLPDNLGKPANSHKPLIGWFRIHNLDFMVVSCYLLNSSKSQPQTISNFIKKMFPSEMNVIIFEVLSQASAKEGLKPTVCSDYVEIVPQKSTTHLTEKIQCTRIWISESFEKLSTGFCEVVREGLHHLAIPNGWSWGGSVSHSCPTWLELFTSNKPQTHANGLVMSNINGTAIGSKNN